MSKVFLQLPLVDQAQLLRLYSAELGMEPLIVEKDIWVCWALEHLFKIPKRQKMAFKGGTSLSKVYGAIDRFSEDIDVTVDYRDLGGQELAGSISRSAVKRLSEKLRALLAEYSTMAVVPHLKQMLAQQFPNRQVLLEVSEGGERVRIHYDSALEATEGGSSYLATNVLIEFGGRNITEPSETHTIVPYIKQYLPNHLLPQGDVEVLALPRTFWEKATLLHVECNRNEARQSVDRLSRHWFDVYKLAFHKQIKSIISNRELLADVIRHKKAFFYSKYADYDACLVGDLRLVPDDRLKTILEKDYKEMIEAGMFQTQPPSFEEILKVITALEQEVNKATSRI